MATMTVRDIYRPVVKTYSADGPGDATDADYLICIIDIDEDYRRQVTRQILFSDYSGLETEWDAATAVTLLEVAVQATVDAIDSSEPSLSAPQLTIVGKQYTVTP